MRLGCCGLEGVERRDGNLCPGLGGRGSRGRGLSWRRRGCRLREGCGRGDCDGQGSGENVVQSFCETIHSAPPVLCAGFWRLYVFDPCAGAVAVDEDLVGNAADVGFGDGVDLVEFAEELTPVAVAGLVLG